jgi:hypothetical protein
MYSPAAAVSGERTALGYLTWDVLNDCHLIFLEGGRGPPWKQTAQLRLHGAAPHRLGLRARPRTLHAFVTDNTGRVLTVALPR